MRDESVYRQRVKRMKSKTGGRSEGEKGVSLTLSISLVITSGFAGCRGAP